MLDDRLSDITAVVNTRTSSKCIKFRLIIVDRFANKSQIVALCRVKIGAVSLRTSSRDLSLTNLTIN